MSQEGLCSLVLVRCSWVFLSYHFLFSTTTVQLKHWPLQLCCFTFSIWSSSTCLPGYVYFVLFCVALRCHLSTFWTSYHAASTCVYFMWTIAVLLFDGYFVVSFHCWDTLTCVNSELKLREWILYTFSKNQLWTVYKLKVFYVTCVTSYMRDHTMTYPRGYEPSELSHK